MFGVSLSNLIWIYGLLLLLMAWLLYSQVEAPELAATPVGAASMSKRECFGVFCTTYDLKHAKISSLFTSFVLIELGL